MDTVVLFEQPFCCEKACNKSRILYDSVVENSFGRIERPQPFVFIRVLSLTHVQTFLSYIINVDFTECILHIVIDKWVLWNITYNCIWRIGMWNTVYTIQQKWYGNVRWKHRVKIDLYLKGWGIKEVGISQKNYFPIKDATKYDILTKMFISQLDTFRLRFPFQIATCFLSRTPDYATLPDRQKPRSPAPPPPPLQPLHPLIN